MNPSSKIPALDHLIHQKKKKLRFFTNGMATAAMTDSQSLNKVYRSVLSPGRWSILVYAEKRVTV